MTSAIDTAKYIISFFQEREDPITNLKLQKLLYYVQGWHLAIYDECAFSEPLQAWVHGPAQPEVYFQYKKFRWKPIDEDTSAPTINARLSKHIDEVLAEYGTETGYALEHMTHAETPWREARKNLPPDAESTAEISCESMKVYFKQQMNHGQD